MLARLLTQPCHEAGKLQKKLARPWPCDLLAYLVSLARLLRQPCNGPGELQCKLARLWPCHLLASLVLLARLLTQPCHDAGSSRASWRGSGLAACLPPWFPAIRKEEGF